jgi:hypothetical protein
MNHATPDQIIAYVEFVRAVERLLADAEAVKESRRALGLITPGVTRGKQRPQRQRPLASFSDSEDDSTILAGLEAPNRWPAIKPRTSGLPNGDGSQAPPESQTTDMALSKGDGHARVAKRKNQFGIRRVDSSWVRLSTRAWQGLITASPAVIDR